MKAFVTLFLMAMIYALVLWMRETQRRLQQKILLW